jgi:hypothetical protein
MKALNSGGLPMLIDPIACKRQWEIVDAMRRERNLPSVCEIEKGSPTETGDVLTSLFVNRPHLIEDPEIWVAVKFVGAEMRLIDLLPLDRSIVIGTTRDEESRKRSEIELFGDTLPEFSKPNRISDITVEFHRLLTTPLAVMKEISDRVPIDPVKAAGAIIVR